MSAVFDVIVVGAGAAGCVLAARLSEDPSTHVLLLEAGPDPDGTPIGPSIADPFPAFYNDPRVSWPDLQAAVGPERDGGRGAFTRPYCQARVIGGGSSINGMMAARGLPADFDEWARLGAQGWSWADVLPCFRRLENDLDFDGPLHGKSGPIPIRRHRPDQWPVFARAVTQAMQARGVPYVDDLHADFSDCVTAMPMNNLPDRRVSSASGYLDARARARPNLTIRAGCIAERLLFDGNRVTGVRTTGEAGSHDWAAREVVVSCGAILSPALLLRSGIGPAAELHDLGIAPVADVPGVGRNLRNHPGMHIAVHLPRHARQPAAIRAWGHTMMRFSSGLAECPRSDMYAFAVNKSAWHPLGQAVGALSVCVNKPFSVGRVALKRGTPLGMPSVDFRLLEDARDFERMVFGFGVALSLLADPGVTPHVHEVFHPSGGQANALNRQSTANWIKSWLATRLFDLGPGARRLVLGDNVIDPAALAADRIELERTVRELAAGVHHPAGTCRMGGADDALAVTDPHCRVRGVRGLRVADASLMPTLVTAGTHLNVLMIGERAAELIASDRAVRENE